LQRLEPDARKRARPVLRGGRNGNAPPLLGNGLIRKDGEYPLFDGLGSERTVTNSSQTVTGTIIHEAFGQTVATTGSSSNPYKFAATSGYRDDGDAGLSHVGARYYDAQVGRFITRDTELDQHPYLYCNHDPVNGVDPSGHVPKWKQFLITIALIIIGNIGQAPPGEILPPCPEVMAEELSEQERKRREDEGDGGSSSNGAQKVLEVIKGGAEIYIGYEVIK
jgi:RHS repeat-associated protein